jgi:hypothetical protein
MRRHRCDRTPGSPAVRDRPADHANDRRDVPPPGGVCRGRGKRAAAAPMISSFDWKMSVLDKWESSRTPSFASPCGDKVERL